MEPILAHLEQNWPAYTAVLVCLAPIVFFTRKYTVPVIQWFAELAIYFGIFHVLFAGGGAAGALVQPGIPDEDARTG
jgi:hypothetical protein